MDTVRFIIVHWIYNRVGLKPFTQTTEVTDENGVIMFKRVTGDEQGGYICTATNAMGTVTATVNLRIEGQRLFYFDCVSTMKELCSSIHKNVSLIFIL